MLSSNESQTMCCSGVMECMSSVNTNTVAVSLFASLGHCDIREHMFRKQIS